MAATKNKTIFSSLSSVWINLSTYKIKYATSSARIFLKIMPVIMLVFVNYVNFSKYAEIMLLLFISNLVKIPQNNAKNKSMANISFNSYLETIRLHNSFSGN